MISATDHNFKNRVEYLVAQIPKGRVMTYGQLAALCGNPLAARIVGGIAHFGDPKLPWQRVVNKQGGLAVGYPGGRESHKKHLEADGVSVSDKFYVNIEELLWSPNTISPLPFPKSPLVVIVGETASGKSALAMQIALENNGEIISADSWNVYPGFDIGTAKPSKEDQKEVKHHLLDVADPKLGFSAAVYKDLAISAIDNILNKGKLPILVGGTGLYVDAVIFDYGFLPKGSTDMRDELNDTTLKDLLELAERSGINLEDIDIRNKRRVIRAIETNGQRPTQNSFRPNTLIIGVQINKDDLEQRVTTRVDNMLQSGLEVEVEKLAQKYGWDSEPMKGIGYLQWKDYFEGSQSREQTRQRIIRASMGLAKRQRTWFKRNQNIQWCEQPEQAEELVHDFLNTNLLQ